jgi:excisionase family DNA binding protein
MPDPAPLLIDDRTAATLCGIARARRRQEGKNAMSEPPPVVQLLVAPPEAAKALAIGQRTLWALTKRGVIPAVRIGRSVRYDVRDLAAFIDRAKEGGGR